MTLPDTVFDAAAEVSAATGAGCLLGFSTLPTLSSMADILPYKLFNSFSICKLMSDCPELVTLLPSSGLVSTILVHLLLICLWCLCQQAFQSKVLVILQISINTYRVIRSLIHAYQVCGDFHVK